MRTILATLSAAALLSATAPAPAMAADKGAEDLMTAFARCVVRGQPDKAEAFLATAPESREAKDAMKEFAALRSGCLGVSGKLAMRPASLRGALAERLYLDSYPTAPAERDPAAEVPAFQGSGDPAQADYDVTRCAALRDPVAADMLVRSAVRSDEEKVALKRLLPVIGSCTPQGAKIGFDRELLHGLMAEGLYKVRRGGQAG